MVNILADDSNFSATIDYDRTLSTFSTGDAIIARDRLCAATTVHDWVRQHGGDELSATYGPNFSLALQLKGEFAFVQGAAYPMIRAGFLTASDTRGIRLASTDGKSALYLFTGPIGALQSFRSGLTTTKWESIAGAFRDSQVITNGTDLGLRGKAALPASAGTAFGTTVGAVGNFAHGILLLHRLALDGSVASFDIETTLQGYWTKPIRIGTGGIHSAPIPSTERGSLQAASSVFSSTAPLLYVLQDRRSGVVLLMGIHTQ